MVIIDLAGTEIQVLLKAGAQGGLIDKDGSQGKAPGVSKPCSL